MSGFARRLVSAKTERCESCRGSGVYQGLLTVEPCQDCQGSGEHGTPMAGVDVQAGRACVKIDLPTFCRLYLPGWFHRPFSPQQQTDVADDERRIRLGGDSVRVRDRGTGNTTIFLAGLMYALLEGHRKYVLHVSYSAGGAHELSVLVKRQFLDNSLLRDGYPELNRLQEDRTCWRTLQNRGVLPNGGLMHFRGACSGPRGLARRVGKIAIRPDLILIDDPYTAEIQLSPVRFHQRQQSLRGFRDSGCRKRCSVLEVRS